MFLNYKAKNYYETKLNMCFLYNNRIIDRFHEYENEDNEKNYSWERTRCTHSAHEYLIRLKLYNFIIMICPHG